MDFDEFYKKIKYKNARNLSREVNFALESLPPDAGTVHRRTFIRNRMVALCDFDLRLGCFLESDTVEQHMAKDPEECRSSINSIMEAIEKFGICV